MHNPLVLLYLSQFSSIPLHLPVESTYILEMHFMHFPVLSIYKQYELPMIFWTQFTTGWVPFTGIVVSIT